MGLYVFAFSLLASICAVESEGIELLQDLTEIEGEIKLPGADWRKLSRYDNIYYGNENTQVMDSNKKEDTETVEICFRFCLSHPDTIGLNVIVGVRCVCHKIGIVSKRGAPELVKNDPDHIQYRHYFFGLHHRVGSESSRIIFKPPSIIA